MPARCPGSASSSSVPQDDGLVAEFDPFVSFSTRQTRGQSSPSDPPPSASRRSRRSGRGPRSAARICRSPCGVAGRPSSPDRTARPALSACGFLLARMRSAARGRISPRWSRLAALLDGRDEQLALRLEQRVHVLPDDVRDELVVAARFARASSEVHRDAAEVELLAWRWRAAAARPGTDPSTSVRATFRRHL